MKVTTVSVKLCRAVRLQRFKVHHCEAGLTAELDTGDDLEQAYESLLEDATVIVEEMVAKEVQEFNRRNTNETSSDSRN